MTTIIPAIDLIDGQCVRLRQGDYQQKTIYAKDPVEVASMFADYGIRRLHLVDLDGAKAKHVINYRVLEKIARKTNLTIDYGGGIKTDEDLRKVFDHGASQATVGSIAVTDPELFRKWISQFGSDKMILGADVRGKHIAISGWQDVTTVDIFQLIRQYEKIGVQTVLCTDISKDGMLEGPSVDLYKELQNEFPHLQFIASGGISRIEDVQELNKQDIYGIIIGKALYEGNITLDQIQQYL